MICDSKIFYIATELIPEKISNAPINSDKLTNSLISYFEENKLGWSKTIVKTVGVQFIKGLSSLLWHITNHHDFFQSRAAPIPEIFKRYRDKNDYTSKKLAKPRLSPTN